jgi:hypothetical protein
MDIVRSKQWLNFKAENGLDGGSISGRRDSQDTRIRKSIAHKDKILGPQSTEQRSNISLGRRGKGLGPHSKEIVAKRSATLRGKKQKTLVCPHCNLIGGNSNMLRWHFDNCKYNGEVHEQR